MHPVVPAARAPRQEVSATASALRDLLRAELLRGHYDARPLPDEAALQRTHAVSRGAVRAALELLREEGLVERLRGQGTFVSARKKVHRTEVVRGLHGRGRDRVVHEVLRREVVPAHSVLPDVLRVPVGTELVRLDRVTRVGVERVGLWTGYLPLDLVRPLLDHRRDLSGDWYDELERVLGRAVGRSDLSTGAVPADEHVAEVLGMRVGAPVLRLERVVLLDDGVPVEFAVGRFRGDRLALRGTRHRREQPPGT